MLTDTHAHLFDEQFSADFEEVIERAIAKNLQYIVIPATDLASSEKAIRLAERYPMIYATAGVHPHDTKNWDSAWLKTIEEFASHPKVVAIGEIGLDYFYDFSPKPQQLKAFRDQIELALSLDLPVVVHNRDSDDDMMEIIRSYSGSGLRAQFHCFNGSLAHALDYIAMHHMISFTGNITFKKSDDLRETVRQIPLKHVMVETDSPYMTPVPFRGKRNEPANVELVLKTLAELHAISMEEAANITSLNAQQFFAMGKSTRLTYVYPLHKALYINITNRCNADCIFCARKEDAMINGLSLRMKKSEEPAAAIYIDQIGDPKKYSEIVFCGYGEPTIRWDVVKEVAAYVKNAGGKTRLNTNGHGNVINKRDITPEMENLIDIVSISLNSTDKKQYAELMRVPEHHFDEMISFARLAKAHTKQVVLSVVDYPDIDKAAAEEFVTKRVGVDFRVRPYF